MLERFQKCISEINHCERFVVAFSGGIDSTALLFLLSTEAPEKTIAVHVDHGLSPNAEQWVASCKNFCEQLGVKFFVEQVDAAPKKGESPEDAARKARYAALAKFIDNKNICLLTAHNQDDQTETVLLQAFRGAGPKGLAAMPKITSFADGVHARPLLSFTREELTAIVVDNKLSWVDDESNQDIRFDRNFIRQNVLPVIKERWPKITTTVSRVAELCAGATELAAEIADYDLSLMSGQYANSISIKSLMVLSEVRQNNVLRFWLQKLGFLMPTQKQMQQIREQMIFSAQDKQPHILLDNFELRRYRDDLFVMSPLDDHDANVVFKWNTQDDLSLPGGLGKLSTSQMTHKKIPQQVTVRFRQGGEVVKLPGQKEHHTLKNLFQEWGVPPWLRDRVPLIYDGDELIDIFYRRY